MTILAVYAFTFVVLGGLGLLVTIEYLRARDAKNSQK